MSAYDCVRTASFGHHERPPCRLSNDGRYVPKLGRRARPGVSGYAVRSCLPVNNTFGWPKRCYRPSGSPVFRSNVLRRKTHRLTGGSVRLWIVRGGEQRNRKRDFRSESDVCRRDKPTVSTRVFRLKNDRVTVARRSAESFEERLPWRFRSWKKVHGRKCSARRITRETLGCGLTTTAFHSNEWNENLLVSYVTKPKSRDSTFKRIQKKYRRTVV